MTQIRRKYLKLFFNKRYQQIDQIKNENVAWVFNGWIQNKYTFYIIKGWTNISYVIHILSFLLTIMMVPHYEYWIQVEYKYNINPIENIYFKSLIPTKKHVNEGTCW